MNELVTQNPFARDVAPVQAPISAPARTDQQRAVAEVQAAMMIARATPRDVVGSMDRILNACTRPTLAEKALYTYARGGTDITGPSIRLAEAIAQQWGNISFGIRELEQSPTISTVQAFAWDVETNTRREVTFQVPLVRHTKKGAYRLEDPRDIYEMVANQGARRLRACILAVIPGDVIEAAVEQCETTLHAKADVGPDAQAKMVTAFREFGVTKEMIEARIQRRLDAIQPAQMVALKKVFLSLRDGMATAAEFFEMPVAADADKSAAANRTDALKSKIKATAGPAEPAKPVEPEPEGVTIPDAMALGDQARRDGKRKVVPPDVAQLGTGYGDAWREGWDNADAEFAARKAAP
jgi:hypothetical protein